MTAVHLTLQRLVTTNCCPAATLWSRRIVPTIRQNVSTKYYKTSTTIQWGVSLNKEINNYNTSNVPKDTREIKRCSSSSSSSSSYIDEWFESIVKSTQFYEDCASPHDTKRKIYFYNVDLQGRVFLEETLPKNIATSIKHVPFLDFLFTHMKHTGTRESQILQTLQQQQQPQQPQEKLKGETYNKNTATMTDITKDYPYVSPCGVELNFMRPADSVIVFHSIVIQNEENTNGSNTKEDNHGKKDIDSKEQKQQQQLLCFAGSLTQPFDPEKLAISPITGRLYHELVAPQNDSLSSKKRTTPLHTTSKTTSSSSSNYGQPPRVEYGLIRSALAVSLSEHIVFNNNDRTNDDDNQEQTKDMNQKDSSIAVEYSDMDFVDETNSSLSIYPIRWLPSYAEPGPWAMPFHEGIDE